MQSLENELSDPEGAPVAAGGQAEALACWREVVVLNCGGTINMSAGEGSRPGDGVSALFEALGADFDRSRLRLLQPFERPPDSSHVGAEEWAIIVGEIRRVDAARRAARVRLGGEALLEGRGGVVLAHGTDTMQVTGLVLALELATRGTVAPVVITGAHSPPGESGSDALSNLAKAIHAATYREAERPHNLPPGVFVLLGEDIHLATRISKVGTTPDDRGRYFSSFPGPIGQISSKDYRLRLDQALLDSVTRHFRGTRLGLERTGDWGRVEHLILDRFVDVGVLRDAVRRAGRAREGGASPGLVIQGDFTQHARLGVLVRLLRDLAEADVPVFIGSMRAWRAVRERFEGGAVFLMPRALSHPAARLKLSWLLGAGVSSRVLGVLMESSLAGEVYEAEGLPGWLKYESFPDLVPGKEVVLAYPGLRAEVVQDAVRRLQAADERRPTLYLYGFGHGHLPGVNRSIAELVDAWLAEELPEARPRYPDIRSLDHLVGELTLRLEALPRERLFAWVGQRYTARKRGLRRVRLSRASEIVQEGLRERLQGPVEAALRGVESESGGSIVVEQRHKLTQAFLSELRFRIDPERLEAAAERSCAEQGLPPGSPLEHQVLVLAPEVLARRVVKDAVMAASPLLRAVGRADDAGISVVVRSQAARGESDVSAYEAGQQLLVLGVKADRGPRWRHEVFMPRRST